MVNISILILHPIFLLTWAKVSSCCVLSFMIVTIVDVPRGSDAVLCKFRPAVQSKRLMDFNAALHQVFGEYGPGEEDSAQINTSMVLQ